MKACLLAGETGERVGIALVYGAMCGLLREPDGRLLDALELYVLEDQLQNPACRRLQKLCEEYPAVCDTMPDKAEYFSTRVKLRMIPLDQRPSEQTADTVLLLGNSSREELSRAAAASLRAALTRFWLSSQVGQATLQSIGDVCTELLLVGGTADGCGSVLLTELAACLKELHPELALDALLMLPDRMEKEGGSQDWQIAPLLKKQELNKEKGAFRQVGVIGIPAGAAFTPEHPAQGSITELLALRFAMRLFSGKTKGFLHWFDSDAECFDWNSFGEEAGLMRQGLGSMMKAGCLYEVYLESFLREKLAAAWRLKDLRNGAVVNRFRTLTDDERYQGGKELSALMQIMRGFRSWMEEVLDSLPVHFRDTAGQRQAMELSAANYRKIIEAAGRRAILQERIDVNGMADEYVVGRADTDESPAEELIRRVKEIGAEIDALENEQEKLNRHTGGAAKFILMDQMLAGIQRALQIEGQRAEQLRSSLTAGSQADIREKKDRLYRLEVHMDLLEKQQDWIRQDILRSEEKGLRALPPMIRSEYRHANDLFSEELLKQLREMQALPETETRQKEKTAQAIQNNATALVLPSGSDMESLKTIQNKVGRVIGDYTDGTAVGSFTACVLAQCLENHPHSTDQQKENGRRFVFMPDLSRPPEKNAGCEELADCLIRQDFSERKQTAPAEVIFAEKLKADPASGEWRGRVAFALLADAWDETEGFRLTAEPLETPWTEATGSAGIQKIILQSGSQQALLGVQAGCILIPIEDKAWQEIGRRLPERLRWFDRNTGLFSDPTRLLNPVERQLLMLRLRALKDSGRVFHPAVDRWLSDLEAASAALQEKEWELAAVLLGAFCTAEGFPARSQYERFKLSLQLDSCLMRCFGVQEVREKLSECRIITWRGVPVFRQTQLQAGELELFPGDEAEKAREEIWQYAQNLESNSPQWCAFCHDKLMAWLEQTEMPEEMYLLLSEKAKELEERSRQNIPVTIRYPIPEDDAAVAWILREALGRNAASLTVSPFSEKMIVMPDAPDWVLQDQVLRENCRVALEDEQIPCYCLPPISPEWIRESIMNKTLSFPLRGMKYAQIMVDGKDHIRAELTVIGSYPLTLVKDYSGEQLFILDHSELFTLSVWPCIPFETLAWHDYRVYGENLPEAARIYAITESGTQEIRDDRSEGLLAGSVTDYPRWLVLATAKYSLGAIPNELPDFSPKQGEEAVIGISFGSSCAQVVIRQGGQVYSGVDSALTRHLVQGRERPAWEKQGSTVSRLSSSIRRSGNTGLIMDDPFCSEELVCHPLWNTEASREQALAVWVHQTLLHGALTAVLHGAAAASWRFTLPAELTAEAAAGFRSVLLEQLRHVTDSTGLQQDAPAMFAEEIHALGCFCRAPGMLGLEDQAFITLDIGSRKADGRLWLPQQVTPVCGFDIQLGTSAMLMDTMMMFPSMIREDLKDHLPPEALPRLDRLTESFENCRRGPHEMALCWGRLDRVLQEYGEVLTSDLFLMSTCTGSLLLLDLSFLFFSCGILLEKAYEDALTNTYLSSRCHMVPMGQGSLLMRNMQPPVRDALVRFARLPMAGEHPTWDHPVTCGEAGLEIVLGLTGSKDPVKEYQTVGKRNFSNRILLAPEQLLYSFLVSFRAAFPGNASILFPDLFDEAGRMTPWGERLLLNETASHFSPGEPVTPEMLFLCLAEIRQSRW